MNPDDAQRLKLGRLTCGLLRSWFELTTHERRAVAIVIFLFTLGVVVRFYRVCLAN